MQYSIIVPVKALNDNINLLVTAILQADADHSAIQLIISPNDLSEPVGFEDAKRILGDFIIHPSGPVGPAEKRDACARIASGKYLIFLDDDSFPETNYFQVTQALIDRGVRFFGGPGVGPRSQGFWEGLSDNFYTSRIGGGFPERYASIGIGKMVADWPSVNLVVEKGIFEAVGGFGSDFWPGEDSVFCAKVQDQAGLRVWYEPSLIVVHFRRNSLGGHLRQVSTYGYFRGFLARKRYVNSQSLLFWIPSLFTILLFLTMVLAVTMSWFFILPVSFYFLVQALAFLRTEGKPSRTLHYLSLVFLSHCAYGIRFIVGFCTQSIKVRLR